MEHTHLVRFTTSLILATVLATSSSCSFVDHFDQFHASTDAGPDAAGPLTSATFLPLFFDGLCSKSVRCEAKSGLGGLLELFCHPTVRALYLDKVFGALAGFNPVLAQQCLDGLGSIDCSISNTLFVAECEQFFFATAATGERCSSDFGCAAGRCDEPPNTCGNVCIDKGNLGDSCLAINGDNDCDSPMRCRQGTCQAPGQIGDACEQAHDCIPLTWCSSANTCQPSPNSGEVCAIDGTTDYSDPCRGSLVCGSDIGSSIMTCRAGRSAGQTCSTAEPCAPGTRCKTGTCHLISAPSGPCVSRDECPSLFECVAEICVPYGAIGASCSPTQPCFQGSCVSNICTALPAGTVCDGSNGLLGGQCAGYCNTNVPSPYACAARGGIGAACSGAYDDAACLDGLGCVDMGGTFSCQACN